MDRHDFTISPDDRILVTGAAGFIGHRLVRKLLEYGFRNLRCFNRSSRDPEQVESLRHCGDGARLEFMYGNLLNREDCAAACSDVSIVFHLAAGRGEKSYADAYLNSVITTRNLLNASAQSRSLVRFVNVSSFAVYSNRSKKSGRLLDESCPIEERPELRGEAYCFAKVKQDEIVREYGERLGVPYVIVRPGVVYGPGNEPISGRVGTNIFGMFLHLGGGNAIPLTYVDNCADAIVLAGITQGIDGEVFNVVDDDLPSSRHFLRLYKQQVKQFRSIYVPHVVSYTLCQWWERYSSWSDGQLPPVFNRARWYANWRRTTYTNRKAKELLGWSPKVPTHVGLERYFSACRNEERHA
jgi:nucleoside-diphosphate-sugar epimerase